MGKTNFKNLVSVIIPFYNRIDYVLESIKSVLNQTYQNFEIILIDDGSQEDISPIKDLINTTKNHVVLIRQKNMGVSTARNAGIKIANGEYIALLDSDDLFLPQKIERQVKVMEKTHAFISHTSYRQMTINGLKIQDMHSGRMNGRIFPKIIESCPIATPTVMVRREVFDELGDPFITDFHIGEDVCLWIDLAYKYDFVGIDEVLTAVRIGTLTAAYDTTKQQIGLVNIISYIMKNPNYMEYQYEISKLVNALQIQFCSSQRDRLEREDFLSKRNQLKKIWNQKENYFKRHAFYPLVSIVIPVFNGSDYLREAIESALLQTYPNIEVLVINDGSNDFGQTEKIALSFGNDIRYFYKENGGVASALNLGIEKMQGVYFSWLSHDDLYLPEKIERQVMCELKLTDKRTILAGGYSLFRAQDGIQFATMEPLIVNTKEQLAIPLFPVFHGLLNGCTMLIHKSHFDRIGMFDVALPTTQDYDLWFRMLRGQSVVFQEGTYVKSRCHDKQGSKQGDHTLECYLLWKKMMDQVTDEECIALDGSRYNFYFNLYSFLKRETNYDKAILYAKWKALNEGKKKLKDSNGECTDILNVLELQNDMFEIIALITKKLYSLKHQDKDNVIVICNYNDRIFLTESFRFTNIILACKLKNEISNSLIFPIEIINHIFEIATLWNVKGIFIGEMGLKEYKNRIPFKEQNIMKNFVTATFYFSTEPKYLELTDLNDVDINLFSNKDAAKVMGVISNNCVYLKNEKNIDVIMQEIINISDLEKWITQNRIEVCELTEMKYYFINMAKSYNNLLAEKTCFFQDNEICNSPKILSEFKTTEIENIEEMRPGRIRRYISLIPKFIKAYKEQGFLFAMKKVGIKVKAYINKIKNKRKIQIRA